MKAACPSTLRVGRSVSPSCRRSLPKQRSGQRVIGCHERTCVPTPVSAAPARKKNLTGRDEHVDDRGIVVYELPVFPRMGAWRGGRTRIMQLAVGRERPRHDQGVQVIRRAPGVQDRLQPAFTKSRSPHAARPAGSVGSVVSSQDALGRPPRRERGAHRPRRQPLPRWPRPRRSKVLPSGPPSHYPPKRENGPRRAVAYGGYWSGRPDLNRRPPVPQTGALPDCATPRQARSLARGRPPSPTRGRRARPSIRGPAGRSGSAARSCPRTARCGPPGRSASRRRDAPPGRAPPRPCRHLPRSRPASPRSPATSGRSPAPRRAGGSATAASRTSRRRRRCRPGPAKVSGLAPAAAPTRIISARPRVMSPALPLSPNPRPSAAPAAIATMFLSAPHSSTPRMSRPTYSRNSRRPSRSAIRAASAGSSAATTAEAGRPRAISPGEVGPGQRGDPGRRDARGLGDDLAHPQQRPGLEALHDRQHVRRRRHERGHARGHRPQVPRRRREHDQVHGVGEGRGIGRGDQLVRQVDPGQPPLVPSASASISAATSAEWHSSVTGSRRATIAASVVPHAPAPTTATRGPAITTGEASRRRLNGAT